MCTAKEARSFKVNAQNTSKTRIVPKLASFQISSHSKIAITCSLKGPTTLQGHFLCQKKETCNRQITKYHQHHT